MNCDPNWDDSEVTQAVNSNMFICNNLEDGCRFRLAQETLTRISTDIHKLEYVILYKTVNEPGNCTHSFLNIVTLNSIQSRLNLKSVGVLVPVHSVQETDSRQV